MENVMRNYITSKLFTWENVNLRVKYESETNWKVLVDGKDTGDEWHTNNSFCGLWLNGRQISGTCDTDYSSNKRTRQKQIRLDMICHYYEVFSNEVFPDY